MKNRVTGIGGIFFKSKDPEAARNWYNKHLGFDTNQWGSTFWWKDKDGNDSSTQWSPFKDDSTYFEPSKKEFMMNFRVEDLDELLNALKEEGVHVFEERQDVEEGKFGWILDPEDNKIELWQPNDKALK